MEHKWLGHDHIPQRFAAQVNAFARDVLSPYLNHHHPCLFATEVGDAKGKVRRRYRRQDVTTPYEKLKSLPNAERFLKPGVTFAGLDQAACAGLSMIFVSRGTMRRRRNTGSRC